MTFLAVVGAIAIVSVVVGLFFTLGRRPEEWKLTDEPAAGTHEFMSSLAGVAGTPLRSGGSVRLLNNGAFLEPLLVAIRGSQRSINFLVYIWEPGRATDQVIDALSERSRAGVEVRVLLDAIGGLRAPKEPFEKLKGAGGKVVTFRSARPGRFSRFHKRNHRRSIVMDGKLAFTGGSAVADKWLGNASNENEWRDFMVEVTGPMAATVQSAFVATWAHSTGEILAGPAFFPEAADAAPAVPGNSILHVGIASAPASENHPLRLFFFQSFHAARKKLYIATPYFVPEKALRRVVAERAKAGVDVRLLLPDEHTDATLIRLTSRHYYQQLLEAGVRIFEYKGTMMHCKSFVIDGIFSVVGSANLDIRSQELNDENVLGIQDAEFARVLEASFLEDLKNSTEIKPEEWKKRGLGQRVKEVVASRLAEQY
jgi:cardiolipin synthase A/B